MKQALFLISVCTAMACNNAEVKTVEPMKKNYSAPEWVYQANIYEVNLRQYTKGGTINDFVEHLPRLKQMGVDVLWFMPVTPIAEKNRKGSLGSYYAAADYTSVSEEFGSVEDFRNMVSKAHELGMKVILDWVANHTGWDHVWTRTHPEYYLIDSTTNDFQIASGMEDIIELDFSNPELVRAMIDAMKFWVNETDIDGFRCDLAFWVELDFWKKARPELDSIKPLFWFGEFDELDEPEYGTVFDASYTWTWMHRARDYYQQQQPLDSLLVVLNRYNALTNNCMRSWFTTNHDENSWNGTEYEKYGDMAPALAVFSATWKGIPLVYSGQEIPNKKRLEFFEKDTIAWTEQPALEEFYRKLFDLRKKNLALHAGNPETEPRVIEVEGQKLLAFIRTAGNQKLVVLLNLSGEMINGNLQHELLKGECKEIFLDTTESLNGSLEYKIEPWGYRVYSS